MLRSGIAVLLICTFFILAGCGTTGGGSGALHTVAPGMSHDQVSAALGPPENRQFNGNLEAWQYCRTGFASDNYTVVWFADGVVTGMTNYTDSVAMGPCAQYFAKIDWRSAPSRSGQHAEPVRPAPVAPATPAKSSGTGFVVDANGTVLTSYHVVAGARQVLLRTVDGQMSTATVTQSSQATDLAILTSNLKATRYLSLAPPRSAAPGMEVFTYGFPVAGILGTEPKYTNGVISSLSGIRGEQTFLQISVPVQPGNSGGPLVDRRGYVVGVIAAQAAIVPFLEGTGSLPQNVNWAVKADYALPLADFPARQPPAATIDQAISRVRDALVYIEATK